MGRPPRPQFPGGIYHVTTRGNRRQPIFTDDRDRERFLEGVATVVQQHGWRCHAYCLMTNHYHLLVETPEPDLSVGMQRLNGGYALWFNRRHDVEGHLFERRFHAVVVESNWHLMELARYIVLNPVRAGLCAHPRRWRWSSYRSAAGHAAPPTFLRVEWLTSQFGRTSVQAREGFRAFVADARPRPPPLVRSGRVPLPGTGTRPPARPGD